MTNYKYLLNLRLSGKRIWVTTPHLGQIMIQKEQATRNIYFLDEIVLLFGLNNQETHLFSTGSKSLREILIARK